MTNKEWREEFEKNIAPEIRKAVAGYGKFIESGNIHLAEDMHDVASTGYSLVTNNHTYNLQIHIQNFIQSLLDKQKEEIIKQLDTLVAPDCIDDNCEYIHEGYFKAVEDIINKIKEM